MRIYPTPLEIGHTEGFDPAKDIFDRAELAKGLTNLVTTVTAPMVIAVDGQWGDGKTTFLQMWAGELRKLDFPVVHFDAFEHDYLDDAFAAIASEILALVQERKKAQSAIGKKFLSTATKTGKIILRSGLKIGVKAATLGVLDAAEIKDTVSDIANEASSLADRHIGELLTGQQARKSAIKEFRETLSQLPILLSNPNAGENESPRSLILIIDELDRCRPAFALEMLERAKHFFSVSNVHFVLGTHLAQLKSCVTATYGNEIDAQTYLQKFIHLTIPLVRTNDYRSQEQANRFTRDLLVRLDLKSDDSNTAELCIGIINEVAKERGLSLRSIERIFSILSVSLAYSHKNMLRLPPILAGLCVLKVEFPELYRAAKAGTLNYSDVAAALCLKEKDKNGEVPWETKWWIYATDKSTHHEWLSDFGRNISFRHNVSSRHDLVPFTANKVMDRFILPRTPT